ncbi:methyltransferase domain-containing protein [Chachezhania antarctica]|uniref:methyltransferase domain-containing protein n=1 Tax=Chachezhania antarctica TaxID=2340860 RepID=UPI000EACCE22|nr:class I SAM-dependent methyltransferase [Chachezhania antarctica]|tara:strand:+ start:849 stop:1628 length:780 start_codon:yes stop_codon:yes gene_type:complete
MHLDVDDIRKFYYRRALGRAAQASVRGQVQRLWPEAKGQTVVGFGFAVPLLRPYLPDARRVIALMPGPQGVMAWPKDGPNVSVLIEETLWPIETGRVDKLILLHGLETSERPARLLDECARVLGPGGKALFVVPNRAGLWSRNDRTPFGYGRPYTLSQLETQIRAHGFEPERHAAALFQPPSERRFWLKSGRIVERLAGRLPAMLAGGVFLVEAKKRVQPTDGTRVKRAQRTAPKPVEGLGEPALPMGQQMQGPDRDEG